MPHTDMLIVLSEDEIVDLCTLSGPRTNFCTYPAIDPMYFIKYSITMGEARTQAYIHDRTTDVPGGPRVPKIHQAFKRDGRTYLVMEFVNAPTVAEFLATHPSKTEDVHAIIASALSWIPRLPLPQQPSLGPIGGGFAKHIFFGPDQEAPLKFVDVLALQRYANEALRHTPGRGPKLTVDFESEARCFYHSDIRATNFLINPETWELTIVDLEHVGILTTSFTSYALHGPEHPFVRDMVARIDFPESKQLPAMSRVACILVQSGGSALDPPYSYG
ncbi:hypothetical protein FRB93_006741 [Tulasnella sp. JGI-2019a]|nr:hypothetical protein FRB93_006741 [Tulasnella sp. JGI-2019a]